jgi:6-phosphogluconate dehydrogenase (decarboxylating)
MRDFAFGVVGLGRIGGGLARQAVARGARVVGVDRGEIDSRLVEAGVVDGGSMAGLREGLPAPRVVLVYVPGVLRGWRHGSVIRGWLVELMEREYRRKGGLAAVPAYVEDTGEVNWLVSDAMRQEVPVPVIAQAVMQLFASRERGSSGARAVAMMRHGFGAHPYGADEGIQRERRESRVGSIHPDPRPWTARDAGGSGGSP